MTKLQKPTTDITFTQYDGIPLTLLRTKGKWTANIASGKASIGPLSWQALIANLEFCLNDRNRQITLGA